MQKKFLYLHNSQHMIFFNFDFYQHLQHGDSLESSSKFTDKLSKSSIFGHI